MSASKPLICLFDLDGTLADYTGELQRRLRLLASPEEPEIQLSGHEWESQPAYVRERLSIIKNNPGFWSELPKLDDGFDILGTVHDLSFDIHVLTKGPRFSPIGWTEKLLWCEKNIPYKHQVTITMDKGLVYGKVLVDDWPEYITAWLRWRRRGTVIMPDRPWNQDFHHPQVVRYIEDVKFLREVLTEVRVRAFLEPADQ